jgi:hypothetical protein
LLSHKNWTEHSKTKTTTLLNTLAKCNQGPIRSAILHKLMVFEMSSCEESLQCWKQGAEAKLFRLPQQAGTQAVVAKVRPPKAYRHPDLDLALRTKQLTREARMMVYLRGVIQVPKLLLVDTKGTTETLS